MLEHRETDRAVLHEQLSYNPNVISLYCGKVIEGYDYSLSDIGETIRKTVDMCFPPFAPLGTDRVIDRYGFVHQNDNWTSWHVSRPFHTVEGARDWLRMIIEEEKAYARTFNPLEFALEYRNYMEDLQNIVGETVILDFSIHTGFCSVFDRMGLELHTFFCMEYPDELEEYMEISTDNAVHKAKSVGDPELSPVVLIAEDFATKQGPIFSPEFLRRFHYPYVSRLTDAWHSKGVKVIYHSDGNFKKAIPDLVGCGVDGFYCLEPNCGMDAVELKRDWPQMVWGGGIDGVTLMECGSPSDVREAVLKQIHESETLKNGGLFIATSSEINPMIRAENFKAMVDAVGELRNEDFAP
jgi:hypothetical protein